MTYGGPGVAPTPEGGPERLEQELQTYEDLGARPFMATCREALGLPRE